jgi:nucleotide-binding universal stress UspA family protein
VIMFNTILVATDGSPLADKAVKAAIKFAKASKGQLVALSVAEAYRHPSFSDGAFSPERQEYERNTEGFAREYVREVLSAARASHVPCRTKVVVSANPHEEILKASNAFHCDTIFVPSHSRKGWDRLSVAPTPAGDAERNRYSSPAQGRDT